MTMPYRINDEPTDVCERRRVIDHLTEERRKLAAHVRAIGASAGQYVRHSREDYLALCKNVDELLEFAVQLAKNNALACKICEPIVAGLDVVSKEENEP